MNEERVIDGVMHRLEGKTFVPMTAEELTSRLLEARETLRTMRTLPAPSAPGDTWPWPNPWTNPWRSPWEPPFTIGDKTGDPVPAPFVVTCEDSRLTAAAQAPAAAVSFALVHNGTRQ